MNKVETFFLKVVHPFVVAGSGVAPRDSIVEMLERDATHVISIGRAKLASDAEVSAAKKAGAVVQGAQATAKPSAQDSDASDDSKAKGGN
jgi:hypothetical protein